MGQGCAYKLFFAEVRSSAGKRGVDAQAGRVRMPRSVGVPQHLAQANLLGKQPDLHGKQRDLREGCSIRCSIQPPGNPTFTRERVTAAPPRAPGSAVTFVTFRKVGEAADF